VLDADLIHLRRPDGRDWDGFLHANPQGREKGLAFFYNPLAEPIEREITIPLYYTGLSDKAMISMEGASPTQILLSPQATATMKITIPARGRTRIVFTEAK
jgi:hypothetical protein